MNIERFEEIINETINKHKELKENIVKLLFEFTEETCYPKSKMYPYALKIMENVLTECLEEVKKQRGKSWTQN